MSLGRIVKGGIWLYGSNLVYVSSGAIYWFIISIIGGPEILGVTSAIIGLASLVGGLAGLGIGVGVLKFVGAFYGKDDEKVSRYFWSSFIFLIFAYSISALTLVLISFFKVKISGLNSEMILFSALSAFMGFSGIFTTFLTALLKTKTIFEASLLASLAKILIGVSLVSLGWGWVGAVIGYVSVAIVNMLYLSRVVFKLVGLKPFFKLAFLHDVIKAGMVSWLPNFINLAGQWLGVLAVFGFSSAFETGLYYVAFSIANVVFMIAGSLSSVLLPVLSGMEDGRKRSTWKAIRVILASAWPLAVFIIVYPWLPLSLLGSSYIKASPVLKVLISSLVFMVLTVGVTNLAYAYDAYMYVLAIGMAANIPRVILYYLLVPFYEGFGAAISFSIGAFTGFLASLYIANKINFKIGFKELALTVVFPLLFGVISYILDLFFIIGGLLIYAGSILAYLKTRVLLKEDLKEIALSMIPAKYLKKICTLILKSNRFV